MPEVPEIASRASEMNTALPGKIITRVEILQPKCINLQVDAFQLAFSNAVIFSVTYHGKWIEVLTSKGWLLINLGMGGEVLLVSRATLPAKHRLVFDFNDNTCLTINFWWFGYAYFAALDGLDKIPMIAKLGPNILELTKEGFRYIIHSQKSKAKVKAVLLDQSKLAGIGNAYIHDILFLAGLHPDQLVSLLNEADLDRLFSAIQDGLLPSLRKNGAFYEMTLFGEKGGFSMEDILIGYREGAPCPNCGNLIQKVKTGSTSSFICPSCQPLKVFI